VAVVAIAAADAAAQLAQFDTIVDARSPAEFAEDHLPGAVNWPVLDDDERCAVGTEYRQISPFEARKRGAALVARNVSRHLERWVLDKPRTWRPLVYCWRGGQRSGTLAWFLDQIGFRTYVLQGGYKAFRQQVIADLQHLPTSFGFTVICGRTGSGKSRLLHALRDAGAQVLDLEGLACHRGSVLGALPAQPQPSQKAFETQLWSALRQFDAGRPVFVESESKKVGNLRVPEELIQRMRAHGRCVEVDLPDRARLELLLQDYAHFASDVEGFCRLLDALVALRGREQVTAWQAAARAGQMAEVFLELMHKHYDPTYQRSTERNFAGHAQSQVLRLVNASPQSMAEAARALMAA
jgi:tRNA 2-selenouridine synthase